MNHPKTWATNFQLMFSPILQLDKVLGWWVNGSNPLLQPRKPDVSDRWSLSPNLILKSSSFNPKFLSYSHCPQVRSRTTTEFDRVWPICGRMSSQIRPKSPIDRWWRIGSAHRPRGSRSGHLIPEESSQRAVHKLGGHCRHGRAHQGVQIWGKPACQLVSIMTDILYMVWCPCYFLRCHDQTNILHLQFLL